MLNLMFLVGVNVIWRVSVMLFIYKKYYTCPLKIQQFNVNSFEYQSS